MAEQSDGDDADGAASRADAVDRLERVIDTQIDAVDDFDQKAAYVTRFVGVVLGLVLTAVSLVSRFGGGDPATRLPAVVAVAGGVVGLVAAVAGAIVTYLSSTVVVGLHPHAARTIADGEYGDDEYNTLLLRAYADAVERNREVLRANARRFRQTLVALLAGITYLAMAAFLFALAPSGVWGWVVLTVGTVAIGVVAWYLLTGRYLRLEPGDSGNER
ncbi:hypothetical protein [Halococcus agarilyticus]|uniref:hypothetical protein n=1 Tax=Halococcus agarilyticus TaxID=1232219 RepID=UPI0006780723|nr:hypothetical protein [Halococcus agarilyticus]